MDESHMDEMDEMDEPHMDEPHMDELHHLKVLLVDDDEDDLLIARELLSDAKRTRFDVECASTYEAAANAIDRMDHDVYIFDYSLGTFTGIDLLRRTIEKGCTAPVILLTGAEDHEVDIAAMQAGAADYLVKGQIQASMLERAIRYSVKQKRAEEEILYMAYYDALTGLPNRTLFHDRLNKAIAHAGRYKSLLAVMFLDLDNFKCINDTLGHTVGDTLLKKIAKRLDSCIRQSDSVARQTIVSQTMGRLGGDEFSLLLVEINEIEEVVLMAQRICKAISKPFMLEGRETVITVSIGIAIFPLDGNNCEDLLMNADTAMYFAKSSGRNNFKFYKHSMTVAALTRMVQEHDLRKALNEHEFTLYYQPQIEVSMGKITNLEVLIRWKHPELGMVLPGKFIPLAEENGMIIPIGEWVLETACKQLKAWQEENYPAVMISVNMSIRQCQQSFVGTVERILKETGLDPKYLELEITESFLGSNFKEILTTLSALKKLGITLSIDDFGSGYFSFSSLKSLPVDIIKIDQCFIRHIDSNQDDRAIVRAIIVMAHTMNLLVVAECVEEAEQGVFLLAEHCDKLQGYLISVPMSMADITKLLQKEKDGLGVGPILLKRLKEGRCLIPAV